MKYEIRKPQVSVSNCAPMAGHSIRKKCIPSMECAMHQLKQETQLYPYGPDTQIFRVNLATPAPREVAENIFEMKSAPRLNHE